MVQEAEYSDLVNVMEKTELFEKDVVGDFFTRSNKQTIGIIYLRIDRVIHNVEWQQQNVETTLNIMELGVSDHDMICLQGPEQRTIRKTHFKFRNVVTTMEGFHASMSTNWNQHLNGNEMHVMWKEL